MPHVIEKTARRWQKNMTGESGGRIWRERGGEKKFVEGGGREWRENECQTIIRTRRCYYHANGGLAGRSAASQPMVTNF
jgi:hypothetical protein